MFARVTELEATEGPYFDPDAASEYPAPLQELKAAKGPHVYYDFVKADGEKNQLELIDPLFVEMLGRVLTHGAQKYAPHNWIKCPRLSRYYGAALRHLNAWYQGQTDDEETGLPHLAHAACCLMFLMRLEKEGLSEDDRDRFHRGS